MKYRKEIDGLRALAVLPVIFFHAGFGFFEGGYVGVDVFFVISGYLITTIILSDLEQGRFSLANFYERRARRILPALFFVMLCSLPFAWMWLAPVYFLDFSKSLVAVSLFSSNFLFWNESGYFATAAELKPLLHTWSLAVEEQYYVLFPVFLIALWKLGGRWVFLSLSLVALTSLVVAQYGVSHHPSSTFYLLHARGWELAIGALIACYFLNNKRQSEVVGEHRILSELSGLTGLFLIGYSVYCFDLNTPFPGLWALLPVVGTALIIIFSTSETLVGRLLGTRVLVGLGLISYSAYLWHFPFFVFARHKMATAPGDWFLMGLIVIALLCALISWRYIEKPFRDRNRFSRRQIFSYAIFGSVFFSTIGLAGYLGKGFPDRAGMPAELLASFERAKPPGECFDIDNIQQADQWLCTLGKTDGQASFFVFGDSHVLSLTNVFSDVAKDLNLTGEMTGSSGCTPFLGIYALRPDQNQRDCNQLNRRVFDHVTNSNIRKIILVARWTYYTDGGYEGENFSYIGTSPGDELTVENSRKAFTYGLNKTVKAYAGQGVEVVILKQVPQQVVEPMMAYQRAYMIGEGQREDYLRDVSVTYARHLDINHFVSGVFSDTTGTRVISFDDILCNTDKCVIGTDDKSYYFDDDHLSVAGASRLAAPVNLLLAH